jgi:RNA polymerase sigma-70 factor, ECF subfamily
LALTDLELVSEAQSGKLTAFDELVARHQERIFVLAYSILSSADDAADVQQETFVRAWRSLKSFRGQAAFTTWLHRIAVNLCLSRKRRRDLVDEAVELDEQNQAGKDCIESIETAIAVRKALSELPAHHRALLVLRELEGRPFEEIAGIVGGSVESVRTRLSRARKLLREKMRPYLEEVVE